MESTIITEENDNSVKRSEQNIGVYSKSVIIQLVFQILFLHMYVIHDLRVLEVQVTVTTPLDSHNNLIVFSKVNFNIFILLYL